MASLPLDFSAEEYLRLNQDVSKAGVDPVHHYVHFGAKEGRKYKDERREKLLAGLKLSEMTGIEIGALCRPFLRPSDGEVIYVDHADTETLKRKYSEDISVNLDDLVSVDAVWGEKTLLQSVGRKADYLVASHVIEHVPSLIDWLNEIEDALVSNGEIRLIIPDKRYSFDYLRAETDIAGVIYAKVTGARTPLPHLVMDYVVNVVVVDANEAWSRSLKSNELRHYHTLSDAIGVTKDALNGNYHDIHCWVFTPRSFFNLMTELVRGDFIHLECTMFYDTQPGTFEFFVGLKRTNDKVAALQSFMAVMEKL